MDEAKLEDTRRRFWSTLSGPFTIKKMTDEWLPEADGSLYWFVPEGGPLAEEDDQLKLLNEVLAEFIGEIAGETIRIILLLQGRDGRNYAYFKYVK